MYHNNACTWTMVLYCGEEERERFGRWVPFFFFIVPKSDDNIICKSVQDETMEMRQIFAGVNSSSP